ncbi:class I adenylate-forming enzyme family protein [Haladaptatus sp. NG-SE-30]
MTQPESKLRKPWFREYQDFGIPESLRPYPEIPVHQILEESANDYPDAGVVQRGRTVTYPKLYEHVERLATALRERGVEKGDRVATVLPTSVQFIVAEHAITRAGGVHIPNDFLDAEDDLAYRLEQGDPQVLIGNAEHSDLLFDLYDDLDIDHLLLTEVDDYSADPPTHDPVRDAEWFVDVIETTNRNPPEVEFDVESDVHTILFTGGTTGRPKGCLLSHRNVLANARQGVASMSQLATMLRGSESALLALPIYHAYGYSVTHSLLDLPVTVLLAPDPRDTEAMVDLIDEHGPVLLFGVPTQFMDIVEEELNTSVVGISGSAPLASETKESFESHGTGVSQGYGLSEMSPITHFDIRGVYEMMLGTTPDDFGSLDQPTIGVPVPDTEVKLIDIDSGKEIPIERAIDEGLEGEMYLNGPQRMLGYLDSESSPFDDEGFVPTGDVVRVDQQGRFYVVDRVKDMINVSGLKVYSEEVDEILFGHEKVRRPATVGVPDPERPGSELVKVYIEAEPDAKGELEPAGIREFLADKVPRHARPDSVEFVEQIPQTAIGKTDKKRLRERHVGHGDG